MDSCTSRHQYLIIIFICLCTHFTLTAESEFALQAFSDKPANIHGEFLYSCFGISADITQKILPEPQLPGLKSLAIQIRPIPFLQISAGSLSTNGLYSRAREPIFPRITSKAPLVIKPKLSEISQSTTAKPQSIGIAFSISNIKLTAYSTFSSNTSGLPDIPLAASFYGCTLESSQLGKKRPFTLSGGVYFQVRFEDRKTDSWFFDKIPDPSPAFFFTLADAYLRYNHLATRLSTFTTISNCSRPHSALRSQTSVSFSKGNICLGLFMCEPEFANSEFQKPAAQLRMYTGLNTEWTMFRRTMILWSTVASWERARPKSWYLQGDEAFTIGNKATLKINQYTQETDISFTSQIMSLTQSFRYNCKTAGKPQIYAKWHRDISGDKNSIQLALTPIKKSIVKGECLIESKNIRLKKIMFTISGDYKYTKAKNTLSFSGEIHVPVYGNSSETKGSLSIILRN